jgi:rod shape determining protein RodA
MRDTSGIFPTVARSEEVNLLGRVERPSWALALTAVALAVVGLATVRSASTELQIDYLPRQVAWVGLGIMVMLAGFFLNYRTLLRFSGVAYGVGLVGLVAIAFIGQQVGGARSWLGWFGLGIQPSEVAKLATVLVLVRFFARHQETSLRWRELLIAGAIVAVPLVLILLEPDLGGALILFPVLAALVWVAGIPARTALGAFLILAIVGAGFWSFGIKDHQRDRILNFVSPEEDPLGGGYQLRQSKIAVGSGELVGKGYMQGTQSQLRFLPARHTDFIFAVLAEERGFVGVLFVLGGYVLYLYYGVRIARRARDPHGILLVVALLAIIAFHVLYNTGMMIGFVPVTGIPLPFLSYGGSFTLFCFFATGLILSVDLRRYVNR